MEVCKKIVSPSVADIFATMVCFIASAIDQKPTMKYRIPNFFILIFEGFLVPYIFLFTIQFQQKGVDLFVFLL